MPINILMPALSPTMEEGTLAKWLVKEGDTVESGDVLCEIETDKATMEFEAVDEGVIGKILVTEGTEGVKVNTPIAVLLEEGEGSDEISDAPAKSDAGQDNADAAACCPRCGRSKSAGRCEKGQCSMPEETTQKGSEVSAPTPKPEPADVGRASTRQPAPAAPTAPKGARIFASPLARRIAAQKGLDLATLTGSGPKGRIVKADVENATAPKTAPTAEAAAPQSADANTVMAMYADREFTEMPLDGMRKIIAARLTEAKQTIPHFYLRRDIQLDALLKFRSELNKSLADKGIKLSVNDFIVKACAMALQEVPDCNAVWAGDRILKLKPSDVAVAVAVEGGLFTPVLRDADTRTLSSLSAEMKDLAARAKERKLAPHEYQGGSFAISNLGMMGITNFDAVINPPHGSILAVGAGEKKPVVNAEGELDIATVMSVTLSVDHRVIDGALGAQFLAAIKQNLENPILMLA